MYNKTVIIFHEQDWPGEYGDYLSINCRYITGTKFIAMYLQKDAKLPAKYDRVNIDLYCHTIETFRASSSFIRYYS